MINPMQSPMGNNPIVQIMNTLNRGIAPQQLAQNIMQQNPQAQEMMNALQQKCGNRNPRDFILEQCRNKGISERDVMQIAQKIAQMLGIR